MDGRSFGPSFLPNNLVRMQIKPHWKKLQDIATFRSQFRDHNKRGEFTISGDKDEPPRISIETSNSEEPGR